MRVAVEVAVSVESSVRPLSFSQRLAADRAALAADPERRERDKQRLIARMRAERDLGLDR